jgi:hypothetical protein
LRLGFPGGVGDAEATALQRNNFPQLLPFSDGDLLRFNGEVEETCPGVKGRSIIVFRGCQGLIPRQIRRGGG